MENQQRINFTIRSCSEPMPMIEIIALLFLGCTHNGLESIAFRVIPREHRWPNGQPSMCPLRHGLFWHSPLNHSEAHLDR